MPFASRYASRPQPFVPSANVTHLTGFGFAGSPPPALSAAVFLLGSVPVDKSWPAPAAAREAAPTARLTLPATSSTAGGVGVAVAFAAVILRRASTSFRIALFDELRS